MRRSGFLGAILGGAAATAGVTAAASPAPPSPYDMTVDSLISLLPTDQLGHLSATVRSLIATRIEGIHYAEGRRSQLLLIGGAVAAAGIAFLPLAMSAEGMPTRWACLTAAVSSILVGLATWAIYLRQTNYSYPFIDPAQNWKWFYHHALPDKTAFGGWFHTKKSRVSERAAYAHQWQIFRNQISGLASPHVDATQDMKQLYLLHVDELYKNLFLTQLRKVLKGGVLLVSVSSLTIFAVASIVETRR